MKRGATMPAVKRKVDPEEFILAALSPRERLEAALRLAGEAFEGSALTAADIRAAARKVRRRLYAARQRTRATMIEEGAVVTIDKVGSRVRVLPIGRAPARPSEPHSRRRSR